MKSLTFDHKELDMNTTSRERLIGYYREINRVLEDRDPFTKTNALRWAWSFLFLFGIFALLYQYFIICGLLFITSMIVCYVWSEQIHKERPYVEELEKTKQQLYEVIQQKQ